MGLRGQEYLQLLLDLRVYDLGGGLGGGSLLNL